MCYVGGPRCPEHPDRAAIRYRKNKVFREHLLTELQFHGVDRVSHPDFDLSAVSVSALPLVAKAAGLDPVNVLGRAGLSGAIPGTRNPRLTESDKASVSLVEAAYVPSPSRVMESIVNDVSQQEALSEAGYNILSERENVKSLRDTDGEHRRLKQACCREVEAEVEFRKRMDTYLNDIVAAQRGAEFVPKADMDVLMPNLPDGLSILSDDTRVDPVYITPLRALGLSDRFTADGTRKPLHDRGRDASLSAAGRRTEVPEHDTRADDLCLSQVGGHVEKVDALVGDAVQNVHLEAVEYTPDGSVNAAVLCAGPLDGMTVPDDVRARALYTAHTIGAPEAVVVSLIRGKPHVLRLDVGTATVEGAVVEGGGTKFSDVVGNTAVNREQMRSLAEQPRAYRRMMDDSERDDVRDAESNLPALFPHIPAVEVRKELARRRGAGESLDSAVRSILRENFDRKKMGNLCGVDGETAGMTNDRRAFSPEYSEWIETGIIRNGPDGKEQDRFEKLHGVHPRVLRLNGTGAEKVHGITPVMVEGKPRFDDDHSDVKDKLLEGDVLVAHNAFFEKKHLGAVIPEVVNGDRPWLDTQWLAAHFLPDDGTGKGRTGLKLQHFVEDTGGQYEGAHRAGADAAMMMEAVERLFSTPGWWERKS